MPTLPPFSWTDDDGEVLVLAAPRPESVEEHVEARRRLLRWSEKIGLGPPFGHEPHSVYLRSHVTALENVAEALDLRRRGQWSGPPREVREEGGVLYSRPHEGETDWVEVGPVDRFSEP